MKKMMTAVMAAVVLAAGMAWAGSQETVNIFESPGKK